MECPTRMHSTEPSANHLARAVKDSPLIPLRLPGSSDRRAKGAADPWGEIGRASLTRRGEHRGRWGVGASELTLSRTSCEKGSTARRMSSRRMTRAALVAAQPGEAASCYRGAGKMVWRIIKTSPMPHTLATSRGWQTWTPLWPNLETGLEREPQAECFLSRCTFGAPQFLGNFPGWSFSASHCS